MTRESAEAFPLRGDPLRRAVAAALPRLRGLSEKESAAPRAPGKWSPREVIGHLIDSASNNHQRFVRAPLQEDLVFPGYPQDTWVRNQNYREAPWADLVELWRLYNLHIARVLDAIPEDVWKRETRKHTFDKILMITVPAGEPVTLENLRRDYVAHLQHHVEQVTGR
ncbi:MAG TPA: DinB family protein [Thermoanaerobaculia bacterium]